MTLDEIEEEYGKTLDKLTDLKQKKVKLESEKILGSLIKGSYYKVHLTECDILYFEFTENNVKIVDMAGTVGYDGWNCISISSGIHIHSTRASYESGVFDNKYISLKLQPEFEEVKKSDFLEIRDRIIKNLQEIK